MSNSKKTSFLILFICVIQPFLMGSAMTPALSKNADKDNPLVKLGGLVGEKNMSNNIKQPTVVPDHPEPKDETNTKKEDNQEESSPSNEIVTISISGKKIQINNRDVEENVFYTEQNRQKGSQKEVSLVDDFADFNTYNKIKTYLEDNHFRFTERELK